MMLTQNKTITTTKINSCDLKRIVLSSFSILTNFLADRTFRWKNLHHKSICYKLKENIIRAIIAMYLQNNMNKYFVDIHEKVKRISKASVHTFDGCMKYN